MPSLTTVILSKEKAFKYKNDIKRSGSTPPFSPSRIDIGALANYISPLSFNKQATLFATRKEPFHPPPTLIRTIPPPSSTHPRTPAPAPPHSHLHDSSFFDAMTGKSENACDDASFDAVDSLTDKTNPHGNSDGRPSNPASHSTHDFSFVRHCVRIGSPPNPLQRLHGSSPRTA